jgi:hypothetical protein
VERCAVPVVAGDAGRSNDARLHLRPFFLNTWLASALTSKPEARTFHKGAERVEGTEVKSVP